jgi:hypothetical protein
MHEKTSPNNLYTTDNTTTNNRQGEDGNFTSIEKIEMDEKEDNKIQWEDQFAITKLINISATILLAHDNLIVCVFEIHPKYHVDLHINFTAMNQEIAIDTTNVIMNIDEDAPKFRGGQ